MNKTSFYILFILVILSSIVYFSESPVQILGTSDALDTEMDATPFAVARNTSTRHYEKNGQLSYVFNALRLEHYKESQGVVEEIFTLVDQPRLVFFQDEQPWVLNAKKGKITDVDQQITLWDEVLVKHTDAAGITTEIHTQKLYINPVEKLVKTNEPVRIQSNKIALNATGMDADLASEKIQLLSDVKGFHDPN